MRFRPPRPLAVDTLTALAMVCVAVLLGQESAAQGWPGLDRTAYVLVVLAHLPVALRGRAPLVVLAAVETANAPKLRPLAPSCTSPPATGRW